MRWDELRFQVPLPTRPLRRSLPLLLEPLRLDETSDRWQPVRSSESQSRKKKEEKLACETHLSG